jgi:hypothetical protein
MRAGAEIIYQAPFVQGDWRGRADFLERVDTDKLVAAAPRAQLVAGTAWLFAHADFDGGALVDTLVIDEAGQVALADALAMGTAARNLSCSAIPRSSPRSPRGLIRRASARPCSSTCSATI